jgi:hypothetical protein
MSLERRFLPGMIPSPTGVGLAFNEKREAKGGHSA